MLDACGLSLTTIGVETLARIKHALGTVVHICWFRDTLEFLFLIVCTKEKIEGKRRRLGRSVYEGWWWFDLLMDVM